MSTATAPTPKAPLRALARLIQFRSEVAIAVALAAGAAAGAAARHVLPLDRGQAATLAAPANASEQLPPSRQPPARPGGLRPGASQAVGAR